MFVGEAPGENEAKEGRPFVGKSGQLLRRIINDLGLSDDLCYFTNVCLCRPPGNKTPTAEMISACYDGLLDEIAAVCPKLIVTLGNVPTKTLGQYTRGVTSVRGTYRELDIGNGVRIGILPTVHPAAVLRNPDLFRDLEQDLRRAVDIAVNGKPPTVSPPTQNYRVITEQSDLDDLFPILQSAKVLAVDLETVSRDLFEGRILDFGVSWEREQAASIDWQLFEASESNATRLRDIVASVPCSFQTASFDIPWLQHRGYFPRLVFDTEIAHWLLDERMGGHDLDSMSMHYYSAPSYKMAFRKRFGIKAYINDETEFAEAWAKIPDYPRRVYNATDADYTYRLTIDLGAEIKRQRMVPLMKLLTDATLLYAELYLEGMCVDLDYLDRLEAKLKDKSAAAKAILDEMASHVNVSSPKQLAAYLFDELGLVPFGVAADGERIGEDIISACIRTVDDPEAREYWQTARIALYEGAGTAGKGRGLSSRSTGAFMLYWLAQQHDFPRSVIAYKKSKKALSTYVGNVRKHMWPDGRVRPDYKLDGTVAGRFKTSRPAIHNLTAGPELYDMYVAAPGFVVLHADYKQADMRMMCHFSGDQHLLEWLKGDPHTQVVQEIGRFTDEQMAAMPRDELKKRRMAAKMVNFGLPYGRSAANLAPQMGLSVNEAQDYIKMYWRRLPQLKAWMDSREADLMDTGQELTSPFGNKRRFPLILDRTHRRECARLAVNFPIMASVNYLTALAHIRTVKRLRAEGIETKVWPHLHDSFNVCVPEDRMDDAIPIVADVMEHVPEYIHITEVPFPVEITAGRRWGTQKLVYDGGKPIE